MEYSCNTRNKYIIIAPNSILTGTKNSVEALLNELSVYTKKDKINIKQNLANVEIGNLKDFEKFLRTFDYQLADDVNEFNLDLVKTQAQVITHKAQLSEILKIQQQFEQKFISILQNNADLKSIIQSYFKLLIKQLSISPSSINIRVGRQFKKLRQNLILNNWNEITQNFDTINSIINENRQKLFD